MYKKGEYLEKNPLWHTEDSEWKAEKIHNFLLKNNICPDSVCEIGCGAGQILNVLSQKLPAVKIFEGYDISPQAIELCKNISNDKIKFHLKDFFKEKNTIIFDVILAIDVFEHIEDYMGFLRKLKTKANLKLFHIPLDISVLTVLQNKPILSWREDLGHLHYFTKDTAIASLIDTGYEIVDSFYACRTLDTPLKSIKSKVARLIRRLCYKINKDFTVRAFGRYSLFVLAK
ncbi:MAG: class I SAM-dependent methyltransferase [Planctomycetota bacterium]|jgi:2-polyprenyl-3-methyl-5-hydroxy-6-metoxy-1,4-benzoquinol methylase